MTPDQKEALTRPIVGIENRTASEVFDIMSDCIRALAASQPAPAADTGQALEARTPFTSPEEWAEKLAELYTWTGSAWLAGECDEDLRTECYSFLCGLIGWLMAGEGMARHPAPLDAERVREAAETVIATGFDFYRDKDGLSASIEGDDGEICWIVPFDAFEELRAALRQKEGE